MVWFTVVGLSVAALDRLKAILEATQKPEVKQELISNTEQAVEIGLFGAPTMFVDGEMFFGQDRLQFVEAALKN